MKRKSSILSVFIVLCLVFGLASMSSAVTLSLEATSDGSTSAIQFARGSNLYLNIIADSPAGIAGCAFTVNYPTNVLTAPATTNADCGQPTDSGYTACMLGNGLPVTAGDITSMFGFTFTKDSNTTQTNRENSVPADGKIYLSGAAIDMTNGGAKSGGSAVLFTIKFTVKADAPTGDFNITLTQTQLTGQSSCNAGYNIVSGVCHPEQSEAIPVLVGAVPNTDTTNWSKLACDSGASQPCGAFPVLLGSATNPFSTVTKTIAAVETPTYTVSGTVTYDGFQTGTLKVGAYTSSAMTTLVKGVDVDWPAANPKATSKNFTLSLPNGTYYLGAYMDSNSNGNMDTDEARGSYASAITISSANDGTTRQFGLSDPMSGGIPLYFTTWKTANSWTQIGGPNDDYDHDGYSNIWEYFNRKMYSTMFNPTAADAATSYQGYVAPSTTPWTLISGQQYNMVVFGSAYDGQTLAATGDWIGAFGPGGDTDCRATAQVGANGSYYLTIIGNTNGDNIHFKLKRNADSQVINAGETVVFASDATIENKVLHFGTRTQTISLVNGWNWVSFNALPSDTSLSAIFGSNEGSVYQVKTQTSSATNVSGTWQGTATLMSKISEGAMFKIKTTAAFSLELTGTPISSTTPIALNNGWTWIAYLPDTVQTPENALASVISVLYQIKSQTASKTMVSGTLTGNLSTMEAGKGYTIKTTAAGTLTYPSQ